jgi:hypothetical protein
MSKSIQPANTEVNFTQEQLLDLNVSELDSAVLSRLVEEVINEDESTVRNYDRAHNRHNR